MKDGYLKVQADKETDEELMIAYASGNEGSFGKLYKRYEARLYGFLFSRLSPKLRNLASDVFQKTWLNVHNGRKGFDPSKKFSTWIFTIAINALRDQISLKEERAPIDALDESLPLASESNQEKEFEREELKQKLRKKIDDLPPMQREAVLLYELEGFSSAEVAGIMKLSDGAIRQLLFRARSTIKQKWREK